MQDFVLGHPDLLPGHGVRLRAGRRTFLDAGETRLRRRDARHQLDPGNPGRHSPPLHVPARIPLVLDPHLRWTSNW